jgi:hypothetical protein
MITHQAILIVQNSELSVSCVLMQHNQVKQGGPSSRCSGRASRHEISAILECDFVLSVTSLQSARR